jgi:hypothetical protein
MSELDKLAIHYGTDKSSLIHDYCVKYEELLPFDKLDKIKILEIGVHKGDSLKTWKDYYPNAQIIGIDINPKCKQCEENRIFIEIGSQYDGEFLKYVIDKHGPFNLILDDGSHINDHVIFSFELLIDSVLPGCLYIIEDTVTSYWPDYGGGLRKNNTMVEYFKNLIDDVNFMGILNKSTQNWNARREDLLIPYSKQIQPSCRTDLKSINFLNSLILITKR